MEQDHAQTQEQIDRRSRALERTALGKCRQIAFQTMDALHQPGHGSCGSPQQQGGHVEQQPGTFGKNRPTALGIRHCLTVGQLDQQVAVCLVELRIDVDPPELRGKTCRLY
ncbi:hypothetical protein D3C80_1092350 [compost metagenome]